MKFKLSHKLWARIAAYLLLIFDVCVLLGAAAGIVEAYEEGWYLGKNTTFAQSQICRSDAFSHTSPVIWAIENGGEIDEEALPQDSNYSYVVEDDSGKVLVDTTNESSKLVSENGIQFSDDQNQNYNYYVDLYVNLPPQEGTELYFLYKLWTMLYAMRFALFYLATLGLILAVVLFVFLMCSAGHVDGSDEIRMLRQDKIPLDLHAALCFGLGGLTFAFFEQMLYSSLLVELVGAAFIALFWSAICFAFLMTLAARLKGGKWWENTVCWRLLRLGLRIAKAVLRRVSDIVKLVPLVWKTALAYVIFMLINFIGALMVFEGGSFFTLLVLFVFDVFVFAGIIMTAGQLKALLAAGRALAAGELDHVVDTVKMRYDLKEHGDSLNSISEGMGRAVEARMKSERLKTELITNVSHDLKTPLTSIVTYVDLLKKEPLGSEAAGEYVEILDRQSAKLKKLTEDLVEASKASSGAMAVNRERVNVFELLSQCAGEYAERLSAAKLEPVVGCKNEDAVIIADGRLLWRVFDNLMQNICKYALPGTRAYLDVENGGGQVKISVKNISASPLNLPADELMERFVRGDEARSTEGSGLGLSIAKSLTELQGGRFDLYLDGDLFKVTLTFPAMQ